MNKPDYIFAPSEKPSREIFEVPLFKANDGNVQGYGVIVNEFTEIEIEIVKWPAPGWRTVDEGTGNEGGVTEGTFSSEWVGDVLFGRNKAVDGKYVFGWSVDPQSASEMQKTVPRNQVLIWHMNYHPDGGQLFFPLENKPFVVPVALPGDDISPNDVVAFWFDGTKGFYIHPNIWHEGVFPTGENQKFLDRQGKVHARISCDFGEEFGVYLSVPLPHDCND